MSNKSNTPRVDALEFSVGPVSRSDMADLARTLERELANARAIGVILLAERNKTRRAIRSTLDRSGGKLYDTDQQTGELFADLLRDACDDDNKARAALGDV